jgi:hypothetical protein
VATRHLFADFSRIASGITSHACDEFLIDTCHNRSAAASPERHNATFL